MVKYIGRNLNACDVKMFLREGYPYAFNVVVVNGFSVGGVEVNKCGHVLLNIGGLPIVDAPGGYYVHIDGELTQPWKYPHYMNEMEYRRYKKENEKTEISRHHIYVPEPRNALLELERLLNEKWRFGLIFNNCATFVDQVLKAGGGGLQMTPGLVNCPKFFFKDLN
jgi:hypothetical protein